MWMWRKYLKRLNFVYAWIDDIYTCKNAHNFIAIFSNIFYSYLKFFRKVPNLNPERIEFLSRTCDEKRSGRFRLTFGVFWGGLPREVSRDFLFETSLHVSFIKMAFLLATLGIIFSSEELKRMKSLEKEKNALFVYFYFF